MITISAMVLSIVVDIAFAWLATPILWNSSHEYLALFAPAVALSSIGGALDQIGKKMVEMA